MDLQDLIRQRYERAVADAFSREPDEVLPTGERVYVVRERLPMSIGLSFRRHADPAPQTPADPAATPDTENREAAPAVAPDFRAADGETYVSGTASSTSVDWYGTEMSAACLQDMAAQFSAGVALLPRHGSFFAPVEWDEVFGRTIEAAVSPATVRDAADPSEQGFVLNIRAKMDPDDPKTPRLCQKLEAGEPIGMSIGGWFLDVRFVRDEEGELKRVIIEKTALDHLAVVRNPANPDSDNLKIARAAGEAAVMAIRSRTPNAATPTPAEPPATRSTASDPASEAGTAPAAPPAATPDPTPEADNRAAVTASRGVDSGATSTDDTGNPSQENTMTPEQIAALVAESVRAALAPVVEKINAVEARAAAAPAAAPQTPASTRGTAEERLAVLEAEREADKRRARLQDEAIANLVDHPSRRGAAVSNIRLASDAGAMPEYDGLIEFARDAGTVPTMVAVATRHKAVFGADSRDPKVTRAQAEKALMSICRAAEADGIVGNLQLGWQ